LWYSVTLQDSYEGGEWTTLLLYPRYNRTLCKPTRTLTILQFPWH